MKKNIFLLFIALTLCGYVKAQDNETPPAQTTSNYSATPQHMWELGVHGGHAFVAGDFDFKPGFGAGLHIRRAIDYLFSIRVDAQYSVFNGEADPPLDNIDEFTTTFISGSVQGIISLNSMKWNKPVRNINIYGLVGLGAGSLDVTVTRNGTEEDGLENLDSNIAPFLDAGAGISFRFSKRFNLGIEHKASFVLARTADYVDGFDNKGVNFTTFRDILNYTSVRLNFNLGNADEKAEPLYWINPLDAVLADVSELKARPVFDLTDTDGDGVIDMVDQEPETAEGAPVDTRGIALDSDGDGVKDYMDQEPYSPPGFNVNQEGIAQQPEYLTEQRVNDMIDSRLKDYELSEKGALAGWFLPIIHFDLDRYTIRHADYGHLASIAYVMKQNPNMKLVVTGYTDQTASEEYNNVLSYNRAKAAIEFLVNTHEISRDRLILNYSGETNTLVPTSGTSFMNRRVEFRVASGETEMTKPDGPNAGKGKFSGSKDAGY